MRIALAVAVTGLAGFAGAAQAEGMIFSARVGPSLGLYQTDSSATVTANRVDPDVEPASITVTASSDDAWESAYGLQVGFAAGMGNFFGDLAIEYLKVDSDAVDNRTDILLTGGYLIGRHWSAFAGYRRGMQGDSAFNDDKFDESGFFVGAGIGGVELGPLSFGASLAYNLSKVDNLPSKDFDYDGISLKFSVSPKNMPQHSLQLRYQRFTGDDSPNLDGGFLDADGDGFADDSDGDGTPDYRLTLDKFELTESYVQLTYAYSFAF